MYTILSIPEVKQRIKIKGNEVERLKKWYYDKKLEMEFI